MPSYQSVARNWQPSGGDAATENSSSRETPLYEEPYNIHNDENDCDDDYDDDDHLPSSAYSMDDFPSLTSIALYCFAIHSIPRLTLTGYTALTEDPAEAAQRSASWRALRSKIHGAPPGKVLLGGLCGVGGLGLGLWQLTRLSRDWDADDDRHEQLRLDPVPYEGLPRNHRPMESIGGFPTIHDEEATTGLALSLAPHDQPHEQQRYRRRWVEGSFRHDKEVLIGPRSAPPGLSPEPPSGQQGFHVLTPLTIATHAGEEAAHSHHDHHPKTVVWIDRGWIPKSLLPKWSDRPHYYQHNPVETARIEKLLKERPLAWTRPEGTVRLKVVLSKTEQSTPFITPEHDFLTKPLQMFWIDGRTLKSIAGSDLYTPEELANEDDDDVVLVSQIFDDIADENDEPNHPSSVGSKGQSSLPYPLVPKASATGSSEITHPLTHMGYAATWFGLSGAGWYWTRKLITRGRG